MTFYWMTLVMCTRFATVHEIFGVEICMTLILTFRIGQGQMQLYYAKAGRRLPVQGVSYWSPFARHSQSKCVWPCKIKERNSSVQLPEWYYNERICLRLVFTRCYIKMWNADFRKICRADFAYSYATSLVVIKYEVLYSILTDTFASDLSSNQWSGSCT